MSFENQYSAVDRLLHQIAFSTPRLQVSLSDIEDRIFAKQLEKHELVKPVFITAIPRAGTTLLLELLVQQGEFVSHCYRDMPFVLMPMFWDRFSRPFRKTDQMRERAHGDGMLINVDSPEAFEEMVWKTFWKKHYKKDHISPWADERDDEFDQYLRSHLRKILFLRSKQDDIQLRYVSKNNLNIARIDKLLRIFPDARIVLPFREPIQHAASLLRQHLNFMEIHSKDSFAMKYMEAIGHYDFGVNLRPVDFDLWASKGDAATPDTLDFWLQYWIAAYRHIQQKINEQVILFNYDAFCGQPEAGLNELGEFLHLQNKQDLAAQASRIRQARPHEVDLASVSSDLIEEANTLYGELGRLKTI